MGSLPERPLVRKKKQLKLAVAVTNDEEDCAVTAVRSSRGVGGQGFGELGNRRRPFPESTEDMVTRLSDQASKLSCFLTSGVDSYNEMAQALHNLENEKGGLANQLALTEAKLVAERAATEAAKTEAMSLRAEVEAARRREAEMVAGQGPLLRAYTERLFRSEKFSELAWQVASVLNARAVSDTIDGIAADMPNLDKSKYGYQEMSDEVVYRKYAEALLKSIQAIPLLDSLASASTFFTAEAVRNCPVDRDDELDEVIANLHRIAETEVEDAGHEEVEAEENEEAEVRGEGETAPATDEARCEDGENAGVVN